VAPVAPDGPAGPGTVTTAGVGVTVVFSQAVRPKVAIRAANNIEYFMMILGGIEKIAQNLCAGSFPASVMN
jgi:hypothetical protein